ncbi:MAG: response regulator transcription factor [Gaiellaceae bacterium]
MRTLVVEDDTKLGPLLRRALGGQAGACDLAERGEDAVWMAKARSYDAIVLDVMLPGLDGYQTCTRLREDEVWTPVLLLTARDAVEDRVHGLDAGADDYLTKPFSIAELRARLRALVRRGARERPAILQTGDLRLDPAAQRVWRGEREIRLSAKELSLLELLMRRAGEAVSRYELLDHTWDMSYDNRSNVVTVHIKHLREKIDRPFGRAAIETVRGSGYRLRSDGG